MTSRTFLPGYIVYSLLAFNVLVFLFLPFVSLLFFLALSAGAFLLFRKKKFIYRDRVKRNNNMFVSPVNGTVEKIIENVQIDDEKYTQVTVLISYFHEWGLYFPISCQVEKVRENKGKKIFRFTDTPKDKEKWDDKRFYSISIRSKEDKKSLLRLYPCKTSSRPKIWPITADRGLSAACFGLFPLGGIVNVYLPENSNILIEEGDLLHPGDTVMANLQ